MGLWVSVGATPSNMRGTDRSQGGIWDGGGGVEVGVRVSAGGWSGVRSGGGVWG